ncbi:hypothetical protein, partial [Hansschlegelia zhihuaiae]|uniref:hypothetical protein n=1 Tax=Hansschlegelia zhihuaiae TaxID=405005 RepID=UPI003D167953
MPEPEPTQHVVDRRQPDHDPLPGELVLDLRERDLGALVHHRPKLRLVRLEQRPAVAAILLGLHASRR